MDWKGFGSGDGGREDGDRGDGLVGSCGIGLATL